MHAKKPLVSRRRCRQFRLIQELRIVCRYYRASRQACLCAGRVHIFDVNRNGHRGRLSVRAARGAGRRRHRGGRANPLRFRRSGRRPVGRSNACGPPSGPVRYHRIQYGNSGAARSAGGKYIRTRGFRYGYVQSGDIPSGQFRTWHGKPGGAARPRSVRPRLDRPWAWRCRGGCLSRGGVGRIRMVAGIGAGRWRIRTSVRTQTDGPGCFIRPDNSGRRPGRDHAVAARRVDRVRRCAGCRGSTPGHRPSDDGIG